MIYQIKVGQTALFTGGMSETLEYLQENKLVNFTRKELTNGFYPLEWLTVYGFELGRQSVFPPYSETPAQFMQ